MDVFELNLDGLVGPTHHYAGLAEGNIASIKNAYKVANPQAAARQGLAKMRFIHALGIKQAVLPPHQRPNLKLLQQLGFTGSAEKKISKAGKDCPFILSAAYSASSMWTANAATITPSIDASDNRVHFTPANLLTNLHRHQEADFSAQLLKTLFNDQKHFQHHPILPRSSFTADEGAANHNRISKTHHHSAMHLYVYGKQQASTHNKRSMPLRYPARQTLEASKAIARSHLTDPQKIFFACQNPAIIDQGVFHNDVISVANESVFLVHQEAFLNQKELLKQLTEKAGFPLTIIEVSSKEMTVHDAVTSYFFNSQLVTLSNNRDMLLIAPSECQDNKKVNAVIERILADSSNPINQVHFIDLKQSMLNGGGPACLRLRVQLNQQEFAAMHQGILLNEDLIEQLDQWIIRHYRVELHTTDLSSPRLIDEVYCALDELTNILQLGSLYPFQL